MGVYLTSDHFISRLSKATVLYEVVGRVLYKVSISTAQLLFEFIWSSKDYKTLIDDLPKAMLAIGYMIKEDMDSLDPDILAYVWSIVGLSSVLGLFLYTLYIRCSIPRAIASTVSQALTGRAQELSTIEPEQILIESQQLLGNINTHLSPEEKKQGSQTENISAAVKHITQDCIAATDPNITPKITGRIRAGKFLDVTQEELDQLKSYTQSGKSLKLTIDDDDDDDADETESENDSD